MAKKFKLVDFRAETVEHPSPPKKSKKSGVVKYGESSKKPGDNSPFKKKPQRKKTSPKVEIDPDTTIADRRNRRIISKESLLAEVPESNLCPATAPVRPAPATNQLLFRKGLQPNRLQVQFGKTISQPVKNSIVENMMQKMGWTGGPLGKTGEGIVEPIIPNLEYALHSKGFGQNPPPQTKAQVKAEAKAQAKAQGKLRREQAARDREAFRLNVLLVVLDFVRNDREVEILFDCELQDKQRKDVHRLVELTRDPTIAAAPTERVTRLLREVRARCRCVLHTQSEGEYPFRYLCVYKAPQIFMCLFTHLDLREGPDIIRLVHKPKEKKPKLPKAQRAQLRAARKAKFLEEMKKGNEPKDPKDPEGSSKEEVGQSSASGVVKEIDCTKMVEVNTETDKDGVATMEDPLKVAEDLTNIGESYIPNTNVVSLINYDNISSDSEDLSKEVGKERPSKIYEDLTYIGGETGDIAIQREITEDHDKVTNIVGTKEDVSEILATNKEISNIEKELNTISKESKGAAKIAEAKEKSPDISEEPTAIEPTTLKPDENVDCTKQHEINTEPDEVSKIVVIKKGPSNIDEEHTTNKDKTDMELSVMNKIPVEPDIGSDKAVVDKTCEAPSFITKEFELDSSSNHETGSENKDLKLVVVGHSSDEALNMAIDSLIKHETSTEPHKDIEIVVFDENSDVPLNIIQGTAKVDDGVTINNMEVATCKTNVEGSSKKDDTLPESIITEINEKSSNITKQAEEIGDETAKSDLNDDSSKQEISTENPSEITDDAKQTAKANKNVIEKLDIFGNTCAVIEDDNKNIIHTSKSSNEIYDTKEIYENILEPSEACETTKSQTLINKSEEIETGDIVINEGSITELFINPDKTYELAEEITNNNSITLFETQFIGQNTGLTEITKIDEFHEHSANISDTLSAKDDNESIPEDSSLTQISFETNESCENISNIENISSKDEKEETVDATHIVKEEDKAIEKETENVIEPVKLDRRTVVRNKIMEVFINFVNTPKFVEFKVIGDFNDEELGIVNEFLDNVWLHVNDEPMDDEELAAVFKSSNSKFYVTEDCNGGIVVLKDIMKPYTGIFLPIRA